MDWDKRALTLLKFSSNCNVWRTSSQWLPTYGRWLPTSGEPKSVLQKEPFQQLLSRRFSCDGLQWLRLKYASCYCSDKFSAALLWCFLALLHIAVFARHLFWTNATGSLILVLREASVGCLDCHEFHAIIYDVSYLFIYQYIYTG